MKLATTTGDFGKYLPDHTDRVKAAAKSGFRYLDFSFYNEAVPTSVFLQPNWTEYVEKIRKCADECGVSFVQSHAPGGNPAVKDKNWDILLASTQRTIEVCGMLGVPKTVIHTGVCGMMNRDEYAEKNRDFFEKLYPIAEKYEVSILVENSMHGNMGNNQFLFTGEDMVCFVEKLGHPLLGCCWDTGHANCEPYCQYDEIMTMGKYLKAIHFNDNRGVQDEHISPFCGTLNIDDVMTGLADSGYSGVFTFECDSTLRPSQYWLGNRKSSKCAAKITEPSLEMQIKADELLYVTGKYILETYGLWED